MSPAVVAGTVAEALAAATTALEAARAEAPRLDAELLLSEAAGVDRVHLLADPHGTVDASTARRFGAMVRRRVAREPVAYILGRKWFRHIELRVDPRVLIPRPETELLVEVALELQPSTVLDVGTGSGAVALAVADEIDGVAVRGSDTSPDAIAVARANAARLGLEPRVSFEWTRFGHMASETRPRRRFELVVANLPYVPDPEWDALPPEIRLYEPKEAVLGGSDGLDPIRALLSALPDCDVIALEIGAGQAAEVERLVAAAGFGSVEHRPDLAGIERVVVGRR